ncbi:uroporphyrinogen-III synthase [Nitratifractor sp.]
MRPIYLTSPKKVEGTFLLPMIRFRIVADRIDYQECDTLIFTSKQAVRSAEAIDPSWKRLPCVAIGPATEREILALGGEVLHRPENFYGESLAQDLVERFRDRRLLYLRPRKVSFDSKAFLAEAGIELKEQVIYETACRSYSPKEAPPKGAIVVFTSPSTIHCFLENFDWDPSYSAVVIGKATLEHLPSGCDVTVAAEPTIDACIEAARSLQDRSDSVSHPK